jgi:hypothetical protein
LIANLLKNPHITGLNIDLLTEKVEIGNYWPVISSNFAHLLMNIIANNYESDSWNKGTRHFISL